MLRIEFVNIELNDNSAMGEFALGKNKLTKNA